MMGQVIPMVSERDIEAAWQAYARHKAKELVDPKLIVNRGHMETSARLHRKWERMFLHGERI